MTIHQKPLALVLLAIIVVAMGWFGLRYWTQEGTAQNPSATHSPAGYVGAAACGECHQPEYAAWQSSHHAKAMQEAKPQTVFGDFNNASFQYNGITTRFFQRDGRYFVNTDGPDGQLTDYPIQYTFGLTPLQQYLIKMPDGRMQALSIAWDSRDKEHGGQRWFHLYPDEKIDHHDPLHWTGPYQNWNFMCADCHSTQVRHNYDAKADTFNTQWNEINVACEACHGPGSEHVAWAKHPIGNDKGLTVDLSGRKQPHRLEQMQQSTGFSFQEGKELQTCAVCHARRTALTNEFKPGEGFNQHYLAAFLQPDLYYADGQIKDEVYEYNSFRQSKMFAKGVTCSDCHDPHALTLRGDVTSVCLQCHEGTKYQQTAHHHHDEKAQVRCVDCHMPQKNYMVVDPRRDHSFRVPRPDLSVRLDVPNACQQCHQEKGNPWAADAVKAWLGRDALGFQRFAEAFHGVRETGVGAEQALQAALRDSTTPPVAKGSLLAEAGGFLYAIPEDVKASLHADSVAERLGALTAISTIPINQRWPLAAHLLQAPERNVRIEAARLLLDPSLDEAQQQQIAGALGELQEAAKTYASRPQWRLIAADIAMKQGQPELAIKEYEAALNIQPTFAQAYANLADTYRALGQEEKAQETLERGLKLSPKEGALHYALGLSLIRQQQTVPAMKELKLATELSPEDREYAYGYALGLYSKGGKKAAFAFLKDRLAKYPGERNNLYLLAQLALAENRPEWFGPYLPKLSQLALSDGQAKQLLDQYLSEKEDPFVKSQRD